MTDPIRITDLRQRAADFDHGGIGEIALLTRTELTALLEAVQAAHHVHQATFHDHRSAWTYQERTLSDTLDRFDFSE